MLVPSPVFASHSKAPLTSNTQSRKSILLNLNLALLTNNWNEEKKEIKNWNFSLAVRFGHFWISNRVKDWREKKKENLIYPSGPT